MSVVKTMDTAPKSGVVGLVNKGGVPCSPCQWSPAGEISEHGCWLWFVPDPSWIEFLDPTGWFEVPEPLPHSPAETQFYTTPKEEKTG